MKLGLAASLLISAHALACTCGASAQSAPPVVGMQPSPGLVCTGGDDTAALQNALNAGLLVLPANGRCIFNTPLTVPSTVANGVVIGMSPYGSSLTYGGSAGGDLISSDGAHALKGWYFANFRIAARNKQSSGTCLHLRGLSRSIIQNLVIDGQDGNGNCYDGAWFDGADFVEWNGGQIRAQNEAFKLNGTTAGGAPGNAAFFLTNVKTEGPPNVSIHIGGNFGGFTCDHMTMKSNYNNVVIDNALNAEQGNREIFLGPNCMIDVTYHGDGVLVNDTLAAGGTLAIQGWQASANYMRDGSNVAGIHVYRWNNLHLSVSGPTVFDNGLGTTPGLQIDDASVVYKVSPATDFHGNQLNCNTKILGVCRP